MLWYVWYVHDQPFDSRIVNPALRYHSLLGPTFMINCQLFDCGLFCLEITTGRASLQQRCSKLKLSFFTNIENLDIFFDIWLHLWPSSFLPRLTASVIFLNMILQSGGKYEKIFYIFLRHASFMQINLLFKPLCCALRDQNGKEHFQKHSGELRAGSEAKNFLGNP